MSGYVYAAQIGDFVKVGYTWNPESRLINLRSEYRCAVWFIGVADASYRDEHRFHLEHKQYAVAPEIYPQDAPPVVELLARLAPPAGDRRAYQRVGPNKWKSPLPSGMIPMSRHMRLTNGAAA